LQFSLAPVRAQDRRYQLPPRRVTHRCGKLTKYQALGRATRSRALAQLGSREALIDARTAVSSAGLLQDPAILLECLVALLELDPDWKRFQEAEALILRMSENLPDDGLRSRFLLTASTKLAAAAAITVSMTDSCPINRKPDHDSLGVEPP
jgi:hypothetical protein